MYICIYIYIYIYINNQSVYCIWTCANCKLAYKRWICGQARLLSISQPICMRP